MTNQDALQFTGTCLSLAIYPELADAVRAQINSRNVHWETIVSLTSGHLVLPAVNIRLEQAGLKDFLPADLADYLDKLTEQNRQRNRRIHQQIQDITGILNQQNIQPVFLKGSAHLLIELYEDPAERMIGDIDFLLPEEEILPAVDSLIQQGYRPLAQWYPSGMKTAKHYPRLANDDYAAAAEVHLRVLRPPHDRKFTSEEILREKQAVPGNQEMFVPAHRHLIIHNALNAQVNDRSWLNGHPNIRQLYDLMLLSKQQNAQQILEDFPHFKQLNRTWLAMSSCILNFPKKDEVTQTQNIRWRLQPLYLLIQGKNKRLRLHRIAVYLLPRLYRYVTLPLKATIHRQTRKELQLRLSQRHWFKKHLESYRKFFS